MIYWIYQRANEHFYVENYAFWFFETEYLSNVLLDFFDDNFDFSVFDHFDFLFDRNDCLIFLLYDCISAQLLEWNRTLRELISTIRSLHHHQHRPVSYFRLFSNNFRQPWSIFCNPYHDWKTRYNNQSQFVNKLPFTGTYPSSWAKSSQSFFKFFAVPLGIFLCECLLWTRRLLWIIFSGGKVSSISLSTSPLVIST